MRPGVGVTFDPVGSEIFAELIETHVGRCNG